MVVGHRAALGGCENGVPIFSSLVQFTTLAPPNALIVNFGGIFRSLLCSFGHEGTLLVGERIVVGGGMGKWGGASATAPHSYSAAIWAF